MSDKQSKPDLKVTSIAPYVDSPGKESCLELLRETIKKIEDGDITPDKMLIAYVDSRFEYYSTGDRSCGMRCSEIISLCEITKIRTAQYMGFIPENR